MIFFGIVFVSYFVKLPGTSGLYESLDERLEQFVIIF